METTLEVLTTRKSGREVRRRWPDEVEAQIVSESLRPGVAVNEVACKGLRANRLSTWRTMARQGKLVPALEDAVEFAVLIVDPLGRGRVCRSDRRCRACLRGSGMIFPSNRVRIMVATKPVDVR